MDCRNCKNKLALEFVDLQMSPPSNSFLKKTELNGAEVYYPLKVMVCEKCYLVQLDEYKKSSEIFSDDYIYFSSYSTSWVEHARKYVEKVTDRFSLNSNSLVVEVASNDGYLLQHFVKKNIPSLGVEPTLSTAKAAQEKGIKTLVEFFNVATAKNIVEKYGKADLALGNNVLAHVPDIHDFVGGFQVLLKDDGVLTFEFPHLLKLVDQNQFDTIYHEHFSYLSLYAVEDVLKRHNMRAFDVEELPTHGGSLRVYCTHNKSKHAETDSIKKLRAEEIQRGINSIDFYKGFQEKTLKIKMEAMEFLLSMKAKGHKIAGYGAAAKGNTFLNFCGLKSDIISMVADASPYKQGMYLPGSRIPVVDIEQLKAFEPDYIIIFPWNLKTEIKETLEAKGFKAKIVTFIPNLQIA